MSDNKETPIHGIADALNSDKEAQEELMNPENDIDPTYVKDEDSDADRLPNQ